MVKPAGIVIDIQVYDNATLKDYRMDPDKFDMFSSGLSEKVDPTQIAFFEDGWAGFYKSGKKDPISTSAMSIGKRCARCSMRTSRSSPSASAAWWK